jgi:hypothetical protein
MSWISTYLAVSSLVLYILYGIGLIPFLRPICKRVYFSEVIIVALGLNIVAALFVMVVIELAKIL